ncbi:hypothetical protein COO60DRAFT_1034201 [Scenedesmus sp. NREL 46B-D3]|nr:hypothetical protein COO60DRAFT_1034201 [Scenedesmus sp. NREL 46B-D3]
MGLNFDLLEQLTFYGSYHNNKWNQASADISHHMVPCCRLGIYRTSFPVSSHLLPLLASLPAWLSSSLQLNAAFLALAAYSLYYLCLEPVAGLSWTACVGVPLWTTATVFQQQVPHAWQWALLVHVFSWYMQIHPGHAILEGRKPAVLDSLVQAITLAPLFVWFELLFLLGYRPELYKQLQQRVTASITAHKRQL